MDANIQLPETSPAYSDLLGRKNAVPGDVLVLTKPLGIAVAALTLRWLKDDYKKSRIKLVFNNEERELETALKMAQQYYALTNEPVLELLKTKYNPHAVVELGKKGLIGSSEDLMMKQTEEVDIRIGNFPVLFGMRRICYTFSSELSGFLSGKFMEYRGGVMIAMNRADAIRFCVEMKAQTGMPSWIVGFVDMKRGEKRVASFNQTIHYIDV